MRRDLLRVELSTLRSEEGLDFICGRVEALRSQLRAIGDDPKARFLLGEWCVVFRFCKFEDKKALCWLGNDRKRGSVRHKSSARSTAVLALI